MPWRQHDNVDLLRDMAAHCSYVASCAHGWDLFKSWAFCASFEEIISIACTCQHPVGTHKSIAGAKSNGTYLSHGPRSTRLRLRNNLPLAWPATPHPWDTRMQTSQTLHSFFRKNTSPTGHVCAMARASIAPQIILTSLRALCACLNNG